MTPATIRRFIVLSDLDTVLAEAKKRRWDLPTALTRLVEIETADRAQRSLLRRQARSRIGAFKPIADYDLSWPKSIDRSLVERALALRFMAEGANVILVGQHGLGKTMLLKNIAHQAVLNGHTVVFTNAARLLNDLLGQESARGLERRLKYYCRIRLLAIDEVGYLSYYNRAADLLFELVSRRHEQRRPIIISTNLAFSDWTQVFPHAACTVALIDRPPDTPRRRDPPHWRKLATQRGRRAQDEEKRQEVAAPGISTSPSALADAGLSRFTRILTNVYSV